MLGNRAPARQPSATGRRPTGNASVGRLIAVRRLGQAIAIPRRKAAEHGSALPGSGCTGPWPAIRGAPVMPNHGRQPRSGANRTIAGNPGRAGNAEPCPATAIRYERVVPSHARQPRTGPATVATGCRPTGNASVGRLTAVRRLGQAIASPQRKAAEHGSALPGSGCTGPWPPIRGAPVMPNHGRQPRSGANRIMAGNPGRAGSTEPRPATAIRCERVVPRHARQPRTGAATVRNRMPPDRQRVGRAPDRRPTSRSGHRDPATKSSRAWLGSTGIRVHRTMAGNPGRTGDAEPWPPTAIRCERVVPHHGRQPQSDANR